jgi:pimeloyl-ACP methyl ester carboxylesterase
MNDRATWRAPQLGPARTIDLGGGRRIRAHATGDGPPIVFVHGALVNANLWRKVIPRLHGFTCVALDLPLGSHTVPMPKDADYSSAALADLIGDALDKLDLNSATIVANDTGGGLTQILAARRPEQVGSFVLTSCDAFENFPPRFFRIVLAPARIPGGASAAFRGLWLRPLRRLPIAYGWLTNEPIERDAEDSYVLPVLTSGEIRRDTRRFLNGFDRDELLDATAKLASWNKPALIAWSTGDRFFPAEHAERLATLIPTARLEWVDNSRTFSPEDRPDRLAELIGDFAGRGARTPVA